MLQRYARVPEEGKNPVQARPIKGGAAKRSRRKRIRKTSAERLYERAKTLRRGRKLPIPTLFMFAEGS